MQYMFEHKGKWIKQFKESRNIDDDNVVASGDKFFHKIYGYEVVKDKKGKWHKKLGDKMIGELTNAEILKELSVPYEDLSPAEQKIVDKQKYNKKVVKQWSKVLADKLDMDNKLKSMKNLKDNISNENYHKDKRPGDIVVGKAKDGNPLYGRDKSIKEPKQHSMDKVTISDKGDAMLGKHKADFEYDKDDNLVAIDTEEKELATKAALAKMKVRDYDKMLSYTKNLLKKKEAELERPYIDSTKVKEDIDNLKASIKDFESRKKQVLIQAKKLDAELTKYYPESFYIDNPEDASDLIDVLDDKGQKHWVTQKTYDKHRDYFQNNLTKHQKANQRKTNTAELLDKADKLSIKIANISKQLKSSYGANADALDRELSKLINERDSIYMQLYGKTYSQLRNK